MALRIKYIEDVSIGKYIVSNFKLNLNFKLYNHRKHGSI